MIEQDSGDTEVIGGLSGRFNVLKTTYSRLRDPWWIIAVNPAASDHPREKIPSCPAYIFQAFITSIDSRFHVLKNGGDVDLFALGSDIAALEKLLLLVERYPLLTKVPFLLVDKDDWPEQKEEDLDTKIRQLYIQSRKRAESTPTTPYLDGFVNALETLLRNRE